MANIPSVRPIEATASFDIDAQTLRRAVTTVRELCPSSPLHMSFRRAWRGGGHELFLRAFLRCADDGFTEFLLWRIPAASNGLHTDVQNAWHITARAVATNFAQYLEDVADAQQVRVRIVPSRSSGETQLCVVALPNEGQVRLGPSSTWSCARERCIDQEPRDALPDWTLPGDGAETARVGKNHIHAANLGEPESIIARRRHGRRTAQTTPAAPRPR